MTLEDEFRAALARSAEAVVPEARPLERLYRRRTVQRRRRYAATGAGLVALVAAISFANPLPNGYQGEPADGYGLTTWTQRLIESPTRGSLASDEAYLTELIGRLERSRASLEVSASLSRLQVLFAGDVGTARIAIAVFYNDHAAAMYYRQERLGASVDALVEGSGGGNMPVEPLVVVGGNGQAGAWRFGYQVAVVPQGCSIDTSADGRINPDGTVARTWVTGDPTGVLIRDVLPSVERWRVTCDGQPRFEGPAWAVHEIETTSGTDSFNGLRAAAGFPTDGQVRTAWTGQVNGGPATVVAADGLVALQQGGQGKSMVAGAAAGVPNGPSDPPTVAVSRRDWGLMSTAAAPNAEFFAVRVPERSGSRAVFTNRMLIVAPSRAVRVSVGLASVPLEGGFAVVDVAWPARSLKLVALDAAGEPVATMTVTETDSWALFGEPVIRTW